MAEQPEIVKDATPKTNEEGVKVGTRSSAVDDVDTAARERASNLDNLDVAKADVEDVTPAKLRDFYKTEIKAQRVAPSLTGLETRIRRDYDAAGKNISDEKLRELASEILGR